MYIKILRENRRITINESSCIRIIFYYSTYSKKKKTNKYKSLDTDRIA